MKDDFLKLTLVTNKSYSSMQDYLNFISICCQSGLSAVQIREKHLDAKDILEFGKLLHTLLMPLRIPLIVNDSMDLCLTLNAEGLHLGEADGNVQLARQLLGPDKIIGLTINSLAQLEHANDLPIDYVGLGAIFPTQNKSNIQTIWRLEGLKKAVKISKHPIIAIGGIDESNAHLVMETGIHGIAAINAFHNSKFPETTTRNLRKIAYRETQS